MWIGWVNRVVNRRGLVCPYPTFSLTMRGCVEVPMLSPRDSIRTVNMRASSIAACRGVSIRGISIRDEPRGISIRDVSIRGASI